MLTRIVAISLLVATGSALAAGPDPRTVSLPWTVVAEDPPRAAVVAKRGDIILKQRLLPFGYATLAQDAVDLKTGNLVAPSGTALLQLQTAIGRAYCVAAAPKVTALARARPGSPYLRACFLDEDADGKFESSSEYDGAGIGLPSVSGRLPKHMHMLISPAAYEVRSPENYSPKMYVGIKFDGFATLGATPMFVDTYGPEADGGGLTRAWPRSDDGKGALGKTGAVLLLGARLTVVEDDGSTIRVRVDQGIPAGRIGIWQSRGGGFF